MGLCWLCLPTSSAYVGRRPKLQRRQGAGCLMLGAGCWVLGAGFKIQMSDIFEGLGEPWCLGVLVAKNEAAKTSKRS